MTADKRATIEVAPDGPLICKGLAQITGAGGEAIATDPVIALCRCGRSERRPFCDGTHAAVGFSGRKSDDRARDVRRSYVGKQLTVHDNRGICSHAADCTELLAAVFRHGKTPWIDPDAAEADQVIEIIDRCPSGALSYSIDGVEHRDRTGDPAIAIEKHGPYRVEGGVDLVGEDWLDGASHEHYTLCRCGHSKNKPFCDGQHWHAGYRDDGKRRVAMLGDLEAGADVETEVDGIALAVRLAGGRPVVAAADGRQLAVTVDERWGEVLIERGDLKPAGGAAPEPAANREEPHNDYIRHLATHGLAEVGGHGPMGAMGVPRYELPSWDDLQIVTAQLHELPQLDDVAVDTALVVGPNAKRPLELSIPLIVSDMSFGALSFEAKVALAKGAELAGTGICSGEGGMLPEEQQAASRYFYELASARFGFSFDQLDVVQAFHFKGGQGAKTGTGGHLPACKVSDKIAAVRGLEPGTDAISPARFPDWDSIADFRRFADEVRERTGGIPIGFKLSAQHIEKDIDAALEVGVDYIILDGRGGGTGAAPLLFRDNISVPTLPALARARRHLDAVGARDVTLFITGGLRTPADFVKALALGADGIAVANAAIQAIGCIGARRCNTNTCPAGIATQDETLRKLIDVDGAAAGLARFFGAAVHLMAALTRACGHTRLADLTRSDLTTWNRDVAYLTGVDYGGVTPL